MRLADIAVRFQSKFQQPPKTAAQIAEEVTDILRHDLIRIAEYNLSAARAHLADLEQRMEIAKQSESTLELARWQFQRLPETGMRLTADIMRNIDLLQGSRERIYELLATELRKQWLIEREFPERLTRVMEPA